MGGDELFLKDHYTTEFTIQISDYTDRQFVPATVSKKVLFRVSRTTWGIIGFPLTLEPLFQQGKGLRMIGKRTNFELFCNNFLLPICLYFNKPKVVQVEVR